MFKSLSEIGKVLNENKIFWAVGGSLVLNHYGLCDMVNDIDLLIDKKDYEKAKKLLSEMGTKKVSKDKEIYLSDNFDEYIIDGTNVDVISGFKIGFDGGHYKFIFDQESITKIVKVEGVSIPLTSLEDWYILYQLIPYRSEKVNAIEKYLKTNGQKKINLERALDQNLPKEIISNINLLLTY